MLTKKNTIIIVSGLPRSGTSMMMQILQAGGIDVLSDSVRQKDDNNPQGYFELEVVKKMANDVSFIKDAQGKCLKIISHLLYHLPTNYNYKIIFMQRDINEILISQQKMLEKNIDFIPPSLANTFSKQLEKTKKWLSEQINIKTHFVNYKDMVEAPLAQLPAIASFLEIDFDIDTMKNVVDKKLYRNKL